MITNPLWIDDIRCRIPASLHLENFIQNTETKRKPSPSYILRVRRDGVQTENLNQAGLSERELRRDLQKVKKKEHGADALALRAEERRDKLRKAAGRSTYLMIRGCLNGETRHGEPMSSITEGFGYRLWRGTRRTETSK